MINRAKILSILASGCTLSLIMVPVANAALASDAQSAVVINEVESQGDLQGDWVEIANADPDEEADLSGWTLIDNEPTHSPIEFAPGTTIESGGYLVVYTDSVEPGFGLGYMDSLTLSDADGQQVDFTEWQGHAQTTWGRVPDMTGEFAETTAPTRGLSNVGVGQSPAEADRQWPGDPLEIESIDLGGDFAEEDMSGVDFADDGTAWVVNNGFGRLYQLDFDQDSNSYELRGSWTLRYSDGTGVLDAEGVTVGPEGEIFVSTERDNSNRSASRPSVLSFSPVGPGEEEELKAKQEWNFQEFVGDIGANGGLEAVSWLPNAFDGSFAVGVEDTGEVLFANLRDDGNIVIRQRLQTPFVGVMALDYDQPTSTLTALCDEACEGRSIDLAFDGSKFVPGKTALRPAAMANYANEGFARWAGQGKDSTGGSVREERLLWADDGVSGGVSLRGARSQSVPPGQSTGKGSQASSVWETSSSVLMSSGYGTS